MNIQGLCVADHVIGWMVTSQHTVPWRESMGGVVSFLFNPRLNLSMNVSLRQGLRAKITTKKVIINKIFILLY